MGLSSPKLGGQVEYRGGLCFLPGQPPDDLGCQACQVLREIGALEKLFGVLVDLRRSLVTDLIQVHGELGSVERPAFSQILSRRYYFVPGL